MRHCIGKNRPVVLELNTFPVWLVLTYSISIDGAGLFPIPLKQHLLFGMPSVILFLSPLSSLLVWQQPPAPSNLKVMASLSFVTMSLGFLAFFPSVLPQLAGLKQRLFHLGWCIWFFYLSISFIKIRKKV